MTKVLCRCFVFWLVILFIVYILTPFFIISSGNSGEGIDVNSGLIGFWNFNEGSGDVVNDASGFGNKGTFHGAIWKSGISDSALMFDGVNDYLEIAEPNGLNFGTNTDFTFSAWIKPESTQLSYSTIFGRRNSPESSGYIFFLYNGQLAVQLNEGNGTIWDYKNYISGSQDFSDNLWHHIAATGDRDNVLKFYVDGVLLINQYNISSFRNIDSTSNLYIGWEERNPTATYFHGVIDEGRIYNRVLTEDEIKFLYKNPSGIEPVPVAEITVVVSAAAGTSLIMFIIATDLGKYKFLSFLALFGPLFTRFKNVDDLQQNEKRHCMYEFIEKNEPVTYNEIRKSCNLSNGELYWHAQKMIQQNAIKMEKKGFHLFFYMMPSVEKAIPPLSSEKFIKLNTVQQDIYDYISSHPGSTQSNISASLDIKQQNTSYNLLMLEKFGLIRIEKKGRQNIYFFK